MCTYKIIVRGEFGGVLSAAFSDLDAEPSGGRTVLKADVNEPHELYEILERLGDYAIQVVSLRDVDRAPKVERVLDHG